METRALNVCRSRSPLEYVEDSEEDEIPVQTQEVEYEQGDRLFMTRILPEPTAKDLCATSTTSQKLVEGAHWSAEAQREPFILPNCITNSHLLFVMGALILQRVQKCEVR